MKKFVKYLFIAPVSFLAVIPAVSCGCSTPQDPVKDEIPTDKLVIKNGVLSGFVDGFNPKEYKSLVIPDTVVTIAENAFTGNFTGDDCQLKKIVIPSSVITIKSKAFYGNDAINTYNLSSFNIETINKCDWASDAFGNSSSIGTIIYPRDNDADLDNAIDYLLCDAGLSIGWFDTTKERVVEIDFLDWDKTKNILYGFTDKFSEVPHTRLFTKLEVPYSIKEIADNAFYNEGVSYLQNIKDVSFGLDPETEHTHLESIGVNAFKKSNIKNLQLQQGTVSLGVGAFSDCASLSSVEFPYTLVNISGTCFQNCTSLTSITFPSTLTKLGDNAFGGCNSLNYINVEKLAYIPNDWDVNAFNITAKGGQIICAPAIASEWNQYFSNLKTLGWTTTDKVNILNGYTSVISPYGNATTYTTAEAANIYLRTASEVPQIFVDDLYHSFYEWTKTDSAQALSLNQFNLLVKGVSINSTHCTANFDIYYDIDGKFGSKDFEAHGNWNFAGIPFTVETAVHETRGEGETQRSYLKFVIDKDFINDRWWHLTINETYKIDGEEGSVTDENAYFCINHMLDTSGDEAYKTVGVFMQINKFLEKTGDDWSWGILSSYFQKINIQD